jgi:hypothetical protein
VGSALGPTQDTQDLQLTTGRAAGSAAVKTVTSTLGGLKDLRNTGERAKHQQQLMEGPVIADNTGKV